MTPQQRYFRPARSNDVLIEMVGKPSNIADYMNTFHYYIKVLATDQQRALMLKQCPQISIDTLLTVKHMPVDVALRTLGVKL